MNRNALRLKKLKRPVLSICILSAIIVVAGFAILRCSTLSNLTLSAIASAADLSAANNTITLYKSFSATTYLIQPGDKPIPVRGDSDCAAGVVACKTVFTLTPVAPPPGSTTASQKLAEKNFTLKTASGQTFAVHMRIRQSGAYAGATLSCTSPDGKSSLSSFVAKGPPSDLSFLTLKCPRYSADATHFIDAQIELSSLKGNEFGNAQ